MGAAPRVRHLQELRGPLPRGVHGRQRRGHARKGNLVREKGRWRWRRRQEEVSRVQRVSSERRQRLGFFLDGGVLAQLPRAIWFCCPMTRFFLSCTKLQMFCLLVALLREYKRS